MLSGCVCGVLSFQQGKSSLLEFLQVWVKPGADHQGLILVLKSVSNRKGDSEVRDGYPDHPLSCSSGLGEGKDITGPLHPGPQELKMS